MDSFIDQALKIIDMAPPWFGAMLMAIFIAVLRVVYDRKESSKMRMAMEGLICGSLTVTVSSGAMALGYGVHWYMFIGGFIGFVGSQTIRSIALSLLNKKVNSSIKGVDSFKDLDDNDEDYRKSL